MPSRISASCARAASSSCPRTRAAPWSSAASSSSPVPLAGSRTTPWRGSASAAIRSATGRGVTATPAASAYRSISVLRVCLGRMPGRVGQVREDPRLFPGTALGHSSCSGPWPVDGTVPQCERGPRDEITEILLTGCVEYGPPQPHVRRQFGQRSACREPILLHLSPVVGRTGVRSAGRRGKVGMAPAPIAHGGRATPRGARCPRRSPRQFPARSSSSVRQLRNSGLSLKTLPHGNFA